MTNIILRRRKLGATSIRAISSISQRAIVPIRNDAGEQREVDYLFRWGCTSAQPARHTINTAAVLSWCSDKKQGRLDMQLAGVSVPETWDLSGFTSENRAGSFVARPPHHAQGRRLVHGDSRTVTEAIRRWGDGYISRFIPKVAEYRIYVIQNRVACVARKTPANADAVAWNVAQGGRFDNVRWDDWPKSSIRQALAAAKVSGTDFCGVDVMVDADDLAYVLEVNAAPSLTSEYRQTCFARCFDYIIDNGPDHFPDVPNWRRNHQITHPAIRTR